MDPQKAAALDTTLLAHFLQRSYRNDKPITLVGTEVIPGARAGDNYGSVVLRIKMKFICGSGKIKQRSIIAKTELNWKNMKELTMAFPVFRTEVKMYANVFSLMEDLMEEFEDRRETLWPAMYGFLPYSLLALEDLNESQYKVALRNKSLDLNHALLVVRSLARFHAMSKVLFGRGTMTKEDKSTYPSLEDGGGAVKLFWSALLTVFSDGIRDNWGEEWHDIADRLNKLQDGGVHRFRDSAVNFDSRFEVLCHSDAWVCNMMFKYMEYENIPISVKFFDFALSFASSFMWDVSYFLITSVIPSIRRENQDKLLEAYWEALCSNLKFFNYSGYIPTMDDVKSEWKRLHLAQCIFLGLHIITSCETKVFDNSKIVGHPPHEIINVSAFTDGRAKRTLGDDLKYYSDEGVF